jgi:MFS family permease
MNIAFIIENETHFSDTRRSRALTSLGAAGMADLNWNGPLFACVGISNFCWLPVMGSASDRFGRKPLLIIFTVLALLTVTPRCSG